MRERQVIYVFVRTPATTVVVVVAVVVAVDAVVQEVVHVVHVDHHQNIVHDPILAVAPPQGHHPVLAVALVTRPFIGTIADHWIIDTLVVYF